MIPAPEVSADAAGHPTGADECLAKGTSGRFVLPGSSADGGRGSAGRTVRTGPQTIVDINYYPGIEVGRAVQPDGSALSGWTARPT